MLQRNGIETSELPMQPYTKNPLFFCSMIAGGPQGPCPTLISNMQAGSATSNFKPVCTPDGLFVRVQCDGVVQCLCVNETTGDILKVLNDVPQDGDFDACNGKNLYIF